MFISWLKSIIFGKKAESLSNNDKPLDSESKCVPLPLGQFMVTHTMRKELRDLGYTKFQINVLLPTEAADKIQKQ